MNSDQFSRSTFDYLVKFEGYIFLMQRQKSIFPSCYTESFVHLRSDAEEITVHVQFKMYFIENNHFCGTIFLYCFTLEFTNFDNF